MKKRAAKKKGATGALFDLRAAAVYSP